jgi:hypothetical protein
MILIWFDDAVGEPRVVGATPPEAGHGALNVELLQCSRMLDRLSSAYNAKYESMRDNKAAFAEEAKLAAGPGQKIDFGPDRGTVEITAADVGVLFAVDENGYPGMDLSLGVQPTGPQLYAASVLCDEMARFNIRGLIALNEQAKAEGDGPIGRQKIHVASRGTRIPKRQSSDS